MKTPTELNINNQQKTNCIHILLSKPFQFQKDINTGFIGIFLYKFIILYYIYILYNKVEKGVCVVGLLSCFVCKCFMTWRSIAYKEFFRSHCGLEFRQQCQIIEFFYHSTGIFWIYMYYDITVSFIKMASLCTVQTFVVVRPRAFIFLICIDVTKTILPSSWYNLHVKMNMQCT